MDFSMDEYEKYWDLAIQYGTDYGLKIIGAILIFLIGKWVARRLTDVTLKVMQKAEVDPTLLRFAENLVYMLLMVVVVLAALNTLGVQTTSFVAILGAAGLAVGLALQGTLGNVGSGVLLIIFRPFQVGDFVNAGGEAGSVEAISLFATTLKTPDNKVIIIPNSAVTGGNITNFSAKETRRVELTFGIGYSDDLRKAKGILQEIIDADERVLRDPEPFVAVSELAESSVNFVVRLWVKRGDYWDVYFDTIEKVKLTFDEKGISIPYPQMDIHLDNPEQKGNA
jgi:small conductance mechanosensitive channel